MINNCRHWSVSVYPTTYVSVYPPHTHIHQKIVTDEKERDKILCHIHSAPPAGHSGISATVDKISQRYYWKGLNEDVKIYVSD